MGPEWLQWPGTHPKRPCSWRGRPLPVVSWELDDGHPACEPLLQWPHILHPGPLPALVLKCNTKLPLYSVNGTESIFNAVYWTSRKWRWSSEWLDKHGVYLSLGHVILYELEMSSRSIFTYMNALIGVMHVVNGLILKYGHLHVIGDNPQENFRPLENFLTMLG